MKRFTTLLTSLLILCFAFSSLVVLVGAEPSWIQWSQTFGGINTDGEHHRVYLVEVSDGGFVLAGNTESFGAGYTDIWLIKVDSSGNMEWNQSFGGGKNDSAESLVQTSDGGFAFVGVTESFASGWTECWLIKTDGFGNMVWNRTYGGDDADWGHSLVVTSDGGFAFAGETSSFGAGNYDFWLIKTDLDGNIEWSRTYGGEEVDIANSLIQTLDGGYALAGNTQSFGAGNYDFWLVKTDMQGIPEFPSWIILPLFVTATLVVIIWRKKLCGRLIYL